MLILQEITQHGNSRQRYPNITTLGAFETIAEAHQAAIDRCHEYVRNDQMKWEAPQYETGAWQKGETLAEDHEFAGDNWRQIAPQGYEYNHGKRNAWLRIESVKSS